MEGSGDISRLYFAIKSSDESKSDNKYDIWEYFISKYSTQTIDKSGKRGLTKPRSVEPYLSLARELGFLRQRNQTRTWLINDGAGKAFLDIHDLFDKTPYLLIMTQLLKNDRTFLIPYLKEIINGNYIETINNRKIQIQIVDKVWSYMWRKYSRELILIEPRVKEKFTKRTKLMYADARNSLLFEKRGLNLNHKQTKEFVNVFKDKEYNKVRGDLFLKMSQVYYDILPEYLTENEITKEIFKVISIINNKKYVSAYRLFSIINEINLPNKGMAWKKFLNNIRQNNDFQLNSSFTKGDYLVNIA